jgi:histidine triad (HIT) family protein
MEGHMIYTGDDFYCERVLSGLEKIKIFKESSHALAFFHTKPFWHFHLVVIPKVHIPSFVDLGINSERDLFDLISFVREVANEVQMEKGSARILTNLGEYQDSKHLHFHVCFGKQI